MRDVLSRYESRDRKSLRNTKSGAPSGAPLGLFQKNSRLIQVTTLAPN